MYGPSGGYGGYSGATDGNRWQQYPSGYPNPEFYTNAWFSTEPGELDALTGRHGGYDGSQICRGFGYITAKPNQVLHQETFETEYGPGKVTYRVKGERPYVPEPAPPVYLPPPPPPEPIYMEPPPPVYLPPPRPRPRPLPRPVYVEEPPVYVDDDWEPEPPPPPRRRRPRPPPRDPSPPPPPPPPKPRYRIVARSRDPALARQVQTMLDYSGLQGGRNPDALLRQGMDYVDAADGKMDGHLGAADIRSRRGGF